MQATGSMPYEPFIQPSEAHDETLQPQRRPAAVHRKADEDDYTGFPKVIMYFTGDEDCVQKIMDHTGGTGVARPTHE